MKTTRAEIKFVVDTVLFICGMILMLIGIWQGKDTTVIIGILMTIIARLP